MSSNYLDEILNLFNNDVKTDTYEIYFDTNNIFNDMFKNIFTKEDIEKYKPKIIPNNKDNVELLTFLKEYNDFNKIENITTSIDILLYMIHYFKNYNFKFIIYVYYLHNFCICNCIVYNNFLDKIIIYLNDENNKNKSEHSILLDKFKYLLFIKYISIAILSIDKMAYDRYILRDFMKNIIFEIYYLYDKLNYNIFFDNKYSNFIIYNNICKLMYSKYYYKHILYINGFEFYNTPKSFEHKKIYDVATFNKFLILALNSTLYLKNINEYDDEIEIDNNIKIITEKCCFDKYFIKCINFDKYICNLIYLLLYYENNIVYIIHKINNIIPATAREYFLKLFSKFFTSKKTPENKKYAIGNELYKIFSHKVPNYSLTSDKITTLYYNMYNIVKKNINIYHINNNNDIINFFDNYDLFNLKEINLKKLDDSVITFFIDFIYNNIIIKKNIKYEKSIKTDNILILKPYPNNKELLLPERCIDMNLTQKISIILELKKDSSYNNIIYFYTHNNLLDIIEYPSFVESIVINKSEIFNLNLIDIVKYFIKICVPKILDGSITNEIEIANE